MSRASETIRQVEEALAPYARSREEVTQIRGILATHLQSCIDGGHLPLPLSLAPSQAKITPTPELKGLQREYIKALNANIKAQRAFRDIQRESAPTQTAQSSNSHDRLEEHIASLKLQKKEQRLKVVDQHLELLSLKPAAQPEFLDSENVFERTSTLPAVPKKVVEGFAAGGSAAKADLKDLNKQLEKSVLKAKLLLRQEEKLLEDIKSRSSQFTETIGVQPKFEALSVTRSELIAWIESELSNASGEEADELEEAAQPRSQETDWAQVEGRLEQIRNKYAQYISARKTLIQTISQTSHPVIQPKKEATTADAVSSRPPAPSPAHLYSPYLEAMLEATQDQKGFIAQKSHLNVVLGKEAKNTCQALDHLAEESRIIPLYPSHDKLRRRAGLDEGLGGLEDAGSTSSRAGAWTYAADAAKIALLEAVAEKVEEGQLALEGSMQVLDEIDQLLGRGRDAGEKAVLEDDIWLAEGAPSKKTSRPPTTSKKADETDIWGKIGLVDVDKA